MHYDNFLIITAATKVSSKLSGTANQSIADGKTPRFQVTIHISTNPTNQAKSVVWTRENFLEMIKMAMANSSDHKPHTAPLMGSDGKTRPSCS